MSARDAFASGTFAAVLRIVASTAVLAMALHEPSFAVSDARKECESLARAALPMAKELLRAHGEFSPYGLGLSSSKEVVDLSTAGSQQGEARSAPSQLRRGLAKALESGRMQATALVYEATLSAPSGARSDAIALELAHRDGYAAVMIYPYTFVDGELRIGEAKLVEQKERSRPSPKRRR